MLPTFISFSYGALPATNSVQSSIISQQAYNLCLYENAQGLQTATCLSFGSSGMIPSKTTVTAAPASATSVTATPVTAIFIASFLTDYAGLPCGGTRIQTSNSKGASATSFIGELGQGQ